MCSELGTATQSVCLFSGDPPKNTSDIVIPIFQMKKWAQRRNLPQITHGIQTQVPWTLQYLLTTILSCLWVRIWRQSSSGE